MKKLGNFAVFFLLFIGLVTAQEKHTHNSNDFEAWVNNEFQFDFRKMVDRVLQLDEEQQDKFNRIYLDYLKDQVALAQKQNKLLDEYAEEMKEDDTQEDEAEETADFIEDYWEVSIDQSDLRKDYFDRLEDAIGWKKAFDFFLIENDVRRRLHSVRVYRIFPEVNEFYKGDGYGNADSDSSKMKNSSSADADDSKSADSDTNRKDRMRKNRMDSKDKDNSSWTARDDEAARNSQDEKSGKVADEDYKTRGVKARGVDAYNAWYDENGSMSLDHDYTYSGITSLVAAIKDVEDRYEKARSSDSFDQFEDEVISVAEKLTVKPMSDQHADAARKAFQIISSRIVDMENAYEDAGISNSDALVASAEAINADELLLDQKDEVKKFFRVAGTAINELERHLDTQSVKSTNSNRK